MVRMEDRSDRHAVIVAVPADGVLELERTGLAFPLPIFRGAALDAVVTIGTGASVLVTLLQAPESVRSFAAWVRDRCARSSDSIELKATRGGLQVRLTVVGDIDINVIADFLVAAFEDDSHRS
jgi:hypothetical protein